MPRKYVIKMLEDELDNLLYMVEEEIGFEHTDMYNLTELVRRIKLVRSGAVPEFIEEN